MIHVIASINLAEGTRDAFLVEFHKVVPLVLAEDGCLDYGPTIDVETTLPNVESRPDVVTVVERWDSLEALEDHMVAPHMLEYRKRVKDYVLGAELRILEPAPAAGEAAGDAADDDNASDQ
jgi:quinol monooxygenase YgiN